MFAVYRGPPFAGFLIGVWRRHDIKSEKLNKLNEYMQKVWGPKKTLVIASTDLRCLSVNVPGPMGVFWWSRRK